jgi:hypothetical protein
MVDHHHHHHEWPVSHTQGFESVCGHDIHFVGAMPLGKDYGFNWVYNTIVLKVAWILQWWENKWSSKVSYIVGPV